MFGRRRTLIVVLAIGAVGSLISALSTNFPVLLAGRLMQGVTGAILPLCIGLVHENIPKDRAPMAIGLMISGASIGTAAGLVVGGMIVDQFSWHGIFFTSAGLCIAAALALFAFVADLATPPFGATRRLVLGPGVRARAWRSMLDLFQHRKGLGLGEPMVARRARVTGVALIAWWVQRSLVSPNPLIAIRSFDNRTIAVGSAVTALVSMSTLQIAVFFSLLLQAPSWTAAGLGFSATVAGLAKLPSNLSSTFAGPLGGWLAGRGGGRFAIVVGGLVTTVGWLLYFVLDVNSFRGRCRAACRHQLRRDDALSRLPRRSSRRPRRPSGSARFRGCSLSSASSFSASARRW
jgi:MFS family permease